jgi:hypothetical protein
LSTDDGGFDRSILIEGGTTNFGVFTGTGVWQPTAVRTNEWQHVAVVFRTNDIEFYLNGTRFQYGSAPQGQGTRLPLNLGRNPGFGEPFAGRIDEVTIYDRALSTAEIQTICAAGTAGKYLPVTDRPQITSHPQSLRTTNGSGVSFSVTAASTAPLIYQWRKDGTNLLDGGRITGAMTTTLTISPVQKTDEGKYTFVASNSFGSLISAEAVLTILETGPGFLHCEIYQGIDGAMIADLTSQAKFIQHQPEVITNWHQFEGPRDVADNYGLKVYGYLHPPQTGDYVLAIASDDASQLWLNLTGPPLEKQLIAQTATFVSYRDFGVFPQQRSASLRLEAGRRYYIEALMKEGNGGDHLSVAWQRPGQTSLEIIAGAYLSCEGVPADQPVITQGPKSQLAAVGTSISLSVLASGSPPLSYQWRKNGVALEGQRTSVLVLASAQLPDSGSYSVVVGNAVGSMESQPAKVWVYVAGPGSVICETYEGIPGVWVTDLTVQAKFIQHQPDAVTNWNQFDGPRDVADSFGRKVYGYLHPPQTGDYYFYVASDDNSELWLSPDDNPTHKVRVCHVIGYKGYQDYLATPEQKSAAQYLEAGRRYYVEALMKENSGGDHLSVAWQLPGQSNIQVIGGHYLSSGIEPVVPSPVRLSIVCDGTWLKIQWSGPAKLQQALKVNGPWQDATVTSPYRIEPGMESVFFRAVSEP